jgi:uncharacterized phosphosugar-binding protein
MRGKKYLDNLDRALEHAASQAESMKKAGRLIVDSALKGGRLYIHDPQNIIVYEAVQRSAGLFMMRPLRVGDLPTVRESSEDVAIIFSSNSAVADIDRAFLQELVEKKNVKIIGVCPTTPPTPSGTNPLSEYSELLIDNGLSEGAGGTVDVPFFGERIGPIDIVVNSIIVFSICAEVIGEFLRRGKVPSTYQSLRTNGGIERNARVWEQYRRQGF